VGPDHLQQLPGALRVRAFAEAKAKLGPALDEGNYKKTMAAPCTAIVAYDMAFFEKVPVFSAYRARGWFDTKPGNDLRNHRAAQRQPAGSLPVARRACDRPGLRPDVGLRQREGRRGVLPRTTWRSIFLVNPRQGRSRRRSSRARRG
jgi:3-hydroxypropanoate dehydrogenase